MAESKKYIAMASAYPNASLVVPQFYARGFAKKHFGSTYAKGHISPMRGDLMFSIEKGIMGPSRGVQVFSVFPNNTFDAANAVKPDFSKNNIRFSGVSVSPTGTDVFLNPDLAVAITGVCDLKNTGNDHFEIGDPVYACVPPNGAAAGRGQRKTALLTKNFTDSSTCHYIGRALARGGKDASFSVLLHAGIYPVP